MSQIEQEGNGNFPEECFPVGAWEQGSLLPIRPPSISLTVEPYQSGMRVDAFLAQQLRNFAIWKIQRLATWDAIRVNHQLANHLRRLRTGDTVHVRLLEPPDLHYQPEDYPLEIVFEDAWIVCVNKPPGVIAHPTGNMLSGTLCNFLQAHFDTQTIFPGLLRPGIVHRLDRETSGVIVIAKTHQAHRNLVDAFEHSRVAKSYLAIVEGNMTEDSGVIDLPIGQAKIGSRALMTTRADAKNAKLAKTGWKVLKRISVDSDKSGYTVVLCKPKTGRNHQIRVHLAAIGHPLVGEEFYMKSGQFKPATRDSLEQGRRMNVSRCENSGLSRHALHAAQIELAHPITGVWLKLQAGLPADMLRAIMKLQEKR